MPRKSPLPGFEGAKANGFNEAGAVMPRKSLRQGGQRTPGASASMRPGLLCPGKAKAPAGFPGA